MLSGYNENVNRSLRIKIVKGYNILVTIDKISRDFSVCYFAENTIIHKIFCLLGITRRIVYQNDLTHNSNLLNFLSMYILSLSLNKFELQ